MPLQGPRMLFVLLFISSNYFLGLFNMLTIYNTKAVTELNLEVCQCSNIALQVTWLLELQS